MPDPLPPRILTPWHAVTAIALLAVTHLLIDTYSNAIPAILGLLEVRCGLSKLEAAWFSGYGALTSGASQPLFAWLSDRLDTRLFAGVGLALATLCFCYLGRAHSAVMLFLIYGGGMLGVAMYHPIAASVIGQIWPERRSLLVSIFFVAGMAGSTLGAIAGPHFASSDTGFAQLQWMVVPGLILSLLLQRTVVHAPHRGPAKVGTVTLVGLGRWARWRALCLLYFSSVLRFAVNLVLFYLFLRWLSYGCAGDHPDWNEKQVSHAVAPTLGWLIGTTQIGMALGGIAAGVWVTPPREKRSLILVPILFAPIIMVMPLVALPGTYLLSVIAGAGFAAMIPVSITVAQRWLPQHPSVASGLMLGGAWALSMVSPPIAQWTLDRFGLLAAFTGTAAMLLLSGVLILFIPSSAFYHRAETNES